MLLELYAKLRKKWAVERKEKQFLSSRSFFFFCVCEGGVCAYICEDVEIEFPLQFIRRAFKEKKKEGYYKKNKKKKRV